MTKRTLSLLLAALVTQVFGQELTWGQSNPEPSVGIRLSEPVETEWEFGLIIKSTGNSRQVKATVPIPMDWPEQKVEVIEEKRSDQVGKFRMQNPTRESKQFGFSIGKMIGGQPETATIHFRISKKMILAPEDTTVFQIPERVSSRVGAFLKPSPLIESRHRRIKAIAKELRDEKLGGWEQAEKIYRWVRDNIEYKFDTQNFSCLDALDRKQGDCGELSSLFIAICRAQGIPARAVWIPGHTYPEFYLVDGNGDGHWFPCQAAGSYEFGSMTETKPILQKGDRFKGKDANNRTIEIRYLRPTVICKAPAGRLTIEEWVNRELKNDGKHLVGSAETSSAAK